MNNYRQNDPRWNGLSIGGSIYRMGPYGCLTTATATAFNISGWDITPGDICVHPELYINGLWNWTKVAGVYPQYHYRADKVGAFVFLEVIAVWSGVKHEHWILQHNGIIYDPLDGTVGMKPNYSLTGYGHSADIDPAPVTVPVIVPVVAEVAPEPTTFWVNVTAHTLNVRKEAEIKDVYEGKKLISTNAVADKLLRKGDHVEIFQAVMGDSVNGNNVWLQTKVSNFYIWSGGTDYHLQTSNA